MTPTVVNMVAHANVLSKVLSMLSHVNKRVRDRREIGLPLSALLSLFQRPDASPLVRNFALVYVEMAMERSSTAERAVVLPELLQRISTKPQQHQDMLLRMAMSALQSLAVTGMAGACKPHLHHPSFCWHVRIITCNAEFDAIYYDEMNASTVLQGIFHCNKS